MIRHRRRMLCALLAAAALAGGCASVTAPGSIERVLVFGDSNVDNGNLLRLTGDKLPGAPNWRGRNSNGPSVVEYLAQSLSARLESHGVSGATSGEGNIVAQVYPDFAYVARTGVRPQIDGFASAGGRLGPADLVVLWAGSNDIYNVPRSDRALLGQRIAAAAANLEDAIIRLHGLGARRFVVANRTPRETLGSDNDLNGQDLNHGLAQALDRARARTGADVRLYDAYAAIARMMRAPAEHGFSEANTLCIRVPACAQDDYDQGLKVGHAYINWDAAHKTTRVHMLMAGQIRELLAR